MIAFLWQWILPKRTILSSRPWQVLSCGTWAFLASTWCSWLLFCAPLLIIKVCSEVQPDVVVHLGSGV